MMRVTLCRGCGKPTSRHWGSSDRIEKMIAEHVALGDLVERLAVEHDECLPPTETYWCPSALKRFGGRCPVTP